jgi:hypothetical protein
MHHPFPPLVLLLLLPLIIAGARLRLFKHPVYRWTLAGLTLLVIGASVAAGGVDFVYLKRLKLLLAAATTAIVLLRQRGGFGLSSRRNYRAALLALAAVAWLLHLNFLGFHGTGSTRVFLHLHDLAHYYLGAKYFPELGYADLYTAMLRAEAEDHGAPPEGRRVRDLRTYELVDAGAVLRDSSTAKAAFTPSRWEDFRRDVDYFRRTLGPQYDALLVDHGYNASPLWNRFGGWIANRVPAGNPSGIAALTAIDPLLQLALFGAVAWAFGLEATLLAMIYFCILFGASFGWLGGAYMRHLWLVTLVLSICALQCGWFALAGMALAFSSLLRIFPAAFAVGVACKAYQSWRRQRPVPLRFFIALAGAGTLLLLVSTTGGRGWYGWPQFQANIERHMENTAFNTIGAPHLLHTIVSNTVLIDVTAPTPAAKRPYRLALLFTALPLAIFWLVRRSDRETDASAAAMGTVLIFIALDLACYYYAFLVILVAINRDRPDRLALLFGVEALSYTMLLFEDRDSLIYLYRNLLLLGMLAALYFTPSLPGDTGKALTTSAS